MQAITINIFEKYNEINKIVRRLGSNNTVVGRVHCDNPLKLFEGSPTIHRDQLKPKLMDFSYKKKKKNNKIMVKR